MEASIISPLECTTCSNGRLIYMYDVENRCVFLECEECMTGFRDTRGPAMPFRSEDLPGPSRLATLQEVGSDPVA